MKNFAFPIHLTREDDGGFCVACPSLPGCHSQGDSLEEALANIREAIELTVEDMLAEGESIPDPSQSLHTTLTIEV